MSANIRKKRKKPKFKMKVPNLAILLAISIILFSVSSSACFLKSNESQDPAQTVARALTDVIREFYIVNNIELSHLIVYGEKTQHINDIIDYIMKELNMEVQIKIIHAKEIKRLKPVFLKSVVILTKSEENLTFLNEMSMSLDDGIKKLVSATPEKYKFVVYTEEITTLKQLSKALESNNKKVMQQHPDLRFFEFFIINGQKVLDLVANVLFSETSCGIFVQKLINSYSKISYKWETKLENFEQFRNFHGCMLNFYTYYDSTFYTEPPYEVTRKKPKVPFKEGTFDLIKKFGHIKNNQYRGLINELVQSLAIKSNFTINYFMTHMDYENTLIFHLGNNFEPNSNAEIGIIAYKDKMRSTEFKPHLSNPVGNENFYYLITQNDLYNNYEKMTFAFDETTWILILVTFGLTFVTIAVLHLTSQWFRKIVFGEGVNIPAYNALGIFFGIGQIKLPKKYFGRFILILYIWFCLMIRTCYQSKMFEFITSDMRKPLPKTLDDLIYWNYTIFLHNVGFSDVNNKIINGRDRPEVNVGIVKEFFDAYEDALAENLTTKYAFLVDNELHAFLNGSYNNSLNAMSDEMISKPYSISLEYNHFLFDQVNYFVDSFIPSGITNHFLDYAMWLLYRPFDVDAGNPPKVLTFEILEFGFVLWFAACCLSILVFVCEYLSFMSKLWIKRKLRILIGLIDFLRVLWHRMQDYHDRW